MALSRNKVAVRERAAGSPPFYLNSELERFFNVSIRNVLRELIESSSKKVGLVPTINKSFFERIQSSYDLLFKGLGFFYFVAELEK